MKITRQLLRQWGACYSDSRIRKLIPEAGLTIQQVLDLNVPAADRIWAATRPGVLEDRIARLFAVRCGRRAISRVESPDPRSIAACDVAERFANGLATLEELASAWSAAASAWSAAASAWESWASAYATAASAAASAWESWASAYATAASAAASAWESWASAYVAAADAAAAAADAAADAAAASEREAQVADLRDLLLSIDNAPK